jgi:CubicO group peptidase (beta-lactamase class C family)
MVPAHNVRMDTRLLFLLSVSVASATPLEEAVRAGDAPDAVIAIPGTGGSATSFADEEHTRPMEPGVHFRFGSVTKLFIGNLILKLRDQGMLSLDQPISRYVGRVLNAERITLRQLGTDTSRLPDTIRNPEFQEAIVADPERVWNARFCIPRPIGNFILVVSERPPVFQQSGHPIRTFT